MFEQLAEADPELPTLVIIFGTMLIVALTAMIGGFTSGVLKARARQKTAREVAAYIAEGSMTPQEGENLLRVANLQDKD
jgi:hypothetical protein